MAAEKVVRGVTAGDAPLRMVWQKPEPDRYFWRAPVEVEAARVGELMLFVNPNFARSWFFKLILRDEDVYRWDVAPPPKKHSNPPDRPEGFPGKVYDLEHEHVWVEALDLKCARSLEGFSSSDHRGMFFAFCDRTHVRFEPHYVAPQAFEQLEL